MSQHQGQSRDESQRQRHRAGETEPRDGSDRSTSLSDGREVADPVAFQPRPSRVGRALTLLVGSLAVLALLAGGPAALVGAVGLAGLAVGVLRGDASAVTVGGAVLFGGVLVGGAVGAPAEPLLVAAGATVVAWDVGDQAVSLGAQLGRRADTTRAELVHAAGSGAVATAAAALAYLSFRYLGGSSVLALALLTFGALVIASVLRG